LAREFSLNGKLITCSPESPALGSEKNPHHSFRPLPQRVQDIKPIHSGVRVPAYTKHIRNPTPQELSQRALEENVIRRFQLSTQSAEAIRRAMLVENLVIGWQTSTS
jgi:hypothetical protein